MMTAASARDASLSPKDVVLGFYKKAFVEQNPVQAAEEYISPTEYIQHNPNVPDGREAFMTYFKDFFRTHTNWQPSVIHRAISEGDLVVLHVESRRSKADRPVAIVDIFRVKNNKIVEHWDVIQTTPEISKNSNTMF
jgi:predicted SnoaL-like aldol condensation-catalyzing enzyme